MVPSGVSATAEAVATGIILSLLVDSSVVPEKVAAELKFCDKDCFEARAQLYLGLRDSTRAKGGVRPRSLRFFRNKLHLHP